MISIKQAKKYCKEFTKIENYEKAIQDDKLWVLHHRLETHFSNGDERLFKARLSIEELKALDMYYNRPADELIFLTQSEHLKLHNKGNEYNIGRKHTDEARKNMSEAAKKVWAKDAEHKPRTLGYKHTEETRKHLSETKKGTKLSDYHKQRIGKAFIGRHWFTNGISNVRDYSCPDGYYPGKTIHKRKET